MDQRPPEAFANGDARGWLLMAGRGYGKTRSAAEWLADQARKHPQSYWAVIAPTYDDVQATCFEGESGLLPALGIDRDDPCYNKTKLQVRLPDGTVIRSYSAEKPERVRGPNLWGVWLEEPATWPGTTMWDNVFPAIRRGLAQFVASTTPKPVPMIRQFADRDDGSIVITRGSTFDNEQNLAPHAIAELKTRWQGTRKERQELYGELLEDVPGALWAAATIERTRAVLVD
jgi:phage terminase large subunit-like protein